MVAEVVVLRMAVGGWTRYPVILSGKIETLVGAVNEAHQQLGQLVVLLGACQGFLSSILPYLLVVGLHLTVGPVLRVLSLKTSTIISLNLGVFLVRVLCRVGPSFITSDLPLSRIKIHIENEPFHINHPASYHSPYTPYVILLQPRTASLLLAKQRYKLQFYHDLFNSDFNSKLMQQKVKTNQVSDMSYSWKTLFSSPI